MKTFLSKSKSNCNLLLFFVLFFTTAYKAAIGHPKAKTAKASLFATHDLRRRHAGGHAFNPLNF